MPPTPPSNTHTIYQYGVYVHWEAQQEAHRGPVLQAGEDGVSEDGSHTLLTHRGGL